LARLSDQAGLFCNFAAGRTHIANTICSLSPLRRYIAAKPSFP